MELFHHCQTWQQDWAAMLLQRCLRPPGGGKPHESLETKKTNKNKLEIQLNYNKSQISVAGIPFSPCAMATLSAGCFAEVHRWTWRWSFAVADFTFTFVNLPTVASTSTCYTNNMHYVLTSVVHKFRRLVLSQIEYCRCALTGTNDHSGCQCLIFFFFTAISPIYWHVLFVISICDNERLPYFSSSPPV